MSRDRERTPTADTQSPNEIEAALNEAGAEQVYLLAMNGCEFCAAMKDMLSEQIQTGVVEVLDVEDDDLAIDIVRSVDEEVGVPSLAVQTDDGEYITYQ